MAVMFSMNKSKQLLFAVHLVHDLIADVGAVETGNEEPGAIEAETLNNFLACHAIRCRRQGDAWNVRKPFMQNRKLDILRAEIVPPLRYAMRFIDGEQRKRRARQ